MLGVRMTFNNVPLGVLKQVGSADRQTDQQTDRQTYRQTDRQTDEHDTGMVKKHNW